MDNYITIYVTSQMLVEALADSVKKVARKNIQIELQKDEVEIHVSKRSGKAERPPENMADFIPKLTNLISFETVRLSDDILLDIKEVSWSSALWFFDVAVERAEFEYDKKDGKSRFTYTKGDDKREHNTDESAYAQEPTRKKRPLKEGAQPLPLKVSDENPYFELQDNGATYTITAYIGAEKHVNIPDFIDGKPVCKIGDAAFSSKANKTRKKQLNAIETVIIPNTVEKLGRDVFAGCEKLEKVVFSDAIISIPEAGEHDGFFFGCEALKEVALPKYLERIERKAFNWCSGLETVILPSTLKVIGSQAFAHCQKLSNLLLPGSLEYIADRAFIACDSFTEINFPSQIKTVHEYTCSGQNLKKVVLPEGIEVVESSAFGLAKKLEEIVAPDKFVRWGCMAIDEDSPLYNRYGYNKEDPATALRYMNRNLIGYVGKYSGKVYADVYIQEGTVRLVSYAFSYVNNIEKVHIPQSVIDIEDKAFHCSPDLIICAALGGIAEKYAKQHNMKFEAE